MLPSFWQERLRHAFHSTREMATRDYLNPPHGSIAHKQKKRLQNFYIQLLPKIYETANISCLELSHTPTADVDLGIASQKINIPYLVLYRGCSPLRPVYAKPCELYLVALVFGALHCLFTMKAAGSSVLKPASQSQNKHFHSAQ